MDRSINLTDVDDYDVLYMKTEVRGDVISVANPPDAKHLISCIMSNADKDKEIFYQLILNKKETELLINALKECIK